MADENKFLNPFTGKKDSPYVFGIRGLDEHFGRLYKKHGSTLKKIYKERDLTPNQAFSALEFIDANPDMKFFELKDKLNPGKKMKLRHGGRVHRGRKASSSAEK